MKKTPLFLRVIAGLSVSVLLCIAMLSPMLSKGECAALLGLAERGKPYVFGKEGPDSFDCSGLTRSVFSHFGYDLIHSAQFVAYDKAYPTIEDAKDLRVGDLIFFDTIADKDKCDHVGIWLGANRFVHASSSEKRVMVSRFDEHWRAKYSWGKHLVDNYGYTYLNNLANSLIHKETEAK